LLEINEWPDNAEFPFGTITHSIGETWRAQYRNTFYLWHNMGFHMNFKRRLNVCKYSGYQVLKKEEIAKRRES